MDDHTATLAGSLATAFDTLTGIDQSVLDAIPAAVYVCAADGVIVRYNRTAAELWGRWPAIGDIDQRFCGSLRLYHLDGRPLGHAATPMATALETGEAQRDLEVEMERPDGSRVVVRVNIEPLKGPDGQVHGAINCFQDISERVRAEDVIRANHAELEDFFENANVPMHWVASDGRIIRANRAELEMLGYTAEEYLGHHIAEFHADEETIEDILTRLGGGQKLELYPARLRAKDGSIRHVQISSSAQFREGRMAHTRCVTIDASAAEDRHRLAAIVDSSEDAIVSKDLDGVVTSWNRGAERLFGYAAAEAVGRPLVDLVIPPELREEEDRILARVRRGKRIEPYETVRRRKDGSQVHIQLTVSPVADATGKVVGAAKIARDISVRMRHERALARHVQEQTALYHFVDQLQRAATPDAIYEAALQAICSALGCRRASILRFDDEGVMRFVAWRGLSDGYRQATEGHSPWNRGDRNASPMTVEDIDAADEFEELKATIRGEGIRALAFIPLFAGGGVVGKFMVYHEEPHLFVDREVELAVTIARQLGFSVERHWAEEARRRVEEELRQNQERFRLAIEAAPSGMLQVDQEGRIHLVNAHAEALLGYDRGELIGRKVEMLVPERFRSTHPAFRATYGEAPEARPMGAGRELYALRKDGSEVPVEIGLSPVRTSEGLFVLSAIVDISERRRAEAQRELLLAELNHRVKNTLAVVQGIAYQTFKDTGTSPTVLKAFEGRLGALARAHALLTQSSWENASLGALAAEALSVAGADERRVDIGGPHVLLDPRPALAVAIALHELCTNALKYGALSTEGGHLAVKWEIAGPTEGTLRLTWQESGGPPVAPPAHRGFGTRMIEGALAHDLAGTVTLDFRPEGLRCIIEAPLREGEAV